MQVVVTFDNFINGKVCVGGQQVVDSDCDYEQAMTTYDYLSLLIN